MQPQLDKIDHIHLGSKDREALAEWYYKIFGFTVVDSLQLWADDPFGPLTIGNKANSIHIALFTRTNPSPSQTIAFSTTGRDFLLWITHLRNNEILFRQEDHEISMSLYFSDPAQNPIEITSYDYACLKQNL
ncbi:MAG: VOC family protein [Pseudobacteriovorax sp.]|nr:VOC family protein [Pseudobacteriovorax sp.]